MHRKHLQILIIVSFAAFLASCGPKMVTNEAGERRSTNKNLTNTEWQLVQFESMDDSIGIVRPEDPSAYTMRLEDNGNVRLRLNCNRALGSWAAKSSVEGTGGTFTFGLLGGTRALCPPPSMDEKILADSQYVRSFTMKDGKLHLGLMVDGGIYTWAPKRNLPVSKTSETIERYQFSNSGP